MLNLENLLTFAKQQSGFIDLDSRLNCAIAQFLKAQGHSHPSVGGLTYRFDRRNEDEESYFIPDKIVAALEGLTSWDNITWEKVTAALEAQHVDA